MMSRPFVNSIVFTEDKYSSLDDMWAEIARTLQTLIRQEYKCEIYDDDFNVIVINYEYADSGMGGPYLMWLNDDEAELVETFRETGKGEMSTN